MAKERGKDPLGKGIKGRCDRLAGARRTLRVLSGGRSQSAVYRAEQSLAGWLVRRKSLGYPGRVSPKPAGPYPSMC